MNLSEGAIDRAGLADVRDARRRGDKAALEASIPRLEAADLLALGALADVARSEDVGDEVRIHLRGAPSDLPVLRGKGLELLRRVAIARITRGQRIAVDFGECGFEFAQIALGFGASELVGTTSSKRGLPLENSAKREKEMQGLVERCRRRPVLA
jgi:hypothetical protein